MFPVVKCPVLRSPLCSSICFVCRWWRPCTMAMMDLKSLCGSRPTSPGTFLHFTVTNLAGYIIAFYSDQPCRVHYYILQWPTLPGTLLHFTVTNLAGYIIAFYSDQLCQVHYWILQWPTLPGTFLNLQWPTLSGTFLHFTVKIRNSDYSVWLGILTRITTYLIWF